MIVVDTNIIGYLFLTSPFTQAAENLYLLDDEWGAPLLWRSEFRNVLALYYRKKILSSEEIIALYSTASAMMAGREYEPNGQTVLKLATENGCSAYDCEFITIAQSLGVPLYTADKKLAHAFPETVIRLLSAGEP